MKVDYRAMLEQDDELREFVKECMYESQLLSDNIDTAVAMLANLYQFGMKPKVVARMMQNINEANEDVCE